MLASRQFRNQKKSINKIVLPNVDLNSRTSIRVLLADDHPVVRQGLATSPDILHAGFKHRAKLS
jgi:hypothetical protein